jgi:hypothetical protein
MTQSELLEFASKHFEDCLEILRKKNNDYSHGESALRNFSNAKLVNVDPEDGLLVRMTDKLTRMGNLLHHEAQVKDESIIDTGHDLMNYTLLLLAWLEDNKKAEQIQSIKNNQTI